MLSFLYNLFKIIFILVLPFIILIRGAVYMHFNKGWSSNMSLLVSIGITALLLVIYFSVFYGKLTKKKTKIRYLRRRFAISFFIVGIFVFHGIVFMSGDNAKTTGVEKEFSNLQPILRLGCSTIFLIDKKAIITDASRVPEDYKRMGLKSLKNSLHYKQKDNYAYALDLRTNNRTEIRNVALKYYFKFMGFRTLRHVGTDDHLHISMPCRYRKGAR